MGKQKPIKYLNEFIERVRIIREYWVWSRTKNCYSEARTRIMEMGVFAQSFIAHRKTRR